MTLAAFTSLLRYLVVLGLCFISTAQAATSYKIYNPSTSAQWQGTTNYSSKDEACNALMHARLDGYAASYPVHVMNYTLVANAFAQWSWLPPQEGCKVELFVNGNMGGAYQTFMGYFVTTNVCTPEVLSTQYYYGTGVEGRFSQLTQQLAALSSKPSFPAYSCQDGCIETQAEFTSRLQTQTITTFNGSPDIGFDENVFYRTQWEIQTSRSRTAQSCTCPSGTETSSTGSCLTACPAFTKRVNGLCEPITCPAGTTSNGSFCKIQCTPPKIVNQNGVCETPACPAGQVRKTENGICETFTCTAPLVKVGNICTLPSCPTGQTYVYSNGSGSCQKTDPICYPPKVLKDGQCITPQCGAGMVLDNATAQCKPDPAKNPKQPTNGGTNNSNGVGNNGSGTGTNGVGSGSGSSGTGTGGDTGTTTGTGNGSPTGNGTTGTSTNTGDSGLCKTPPCGNCDPATETCGNTFNGSCDSEYKCNGDAIQCAVALATNKAECAVAALKIDKTNQPLLDGGKTAIDGGTKKLGEAGGIQATNGGSIAINTSNPYGGSCINDYYIGTFKGQSMSIPLSNYCTAFNVVGNIMLLIASLISIKIIMKTDS